MKEDISKSLKSSETDDWLDCHLVRPAGFRWALFFNRLGFSPNTVTIISMVVGAASAVFFAHGCYHYDGWRGVAFNLIGFFLLAWAEVLDCADGQLARLSGKHTRSGRILDGIAGYAWYAPVYAALIYRFYRHHDIEFGWLGITDSPSATWIATAVVIFVTAMSGACLAAQQRLADYYLQAHLYFLKGEDGSELDNSAKQREIYKSMTRDTPLWERLFQFSYIGYTRRQERITPQFQRLLKALNERYSSVSDFPSEIREDFHKSSLKMIGYNDMLTFNFRTSYLILFCLLDVPVLAFLFEIVVMSLLMWYVNHRHESFCKRIADMVEKDW